MPAAPAPGPAAAAGPGPAGPALVRRPEPARERSVTRFTTRDYGYVRRELRRIVILATAIIIIIVVISFFLP
jgi:hypothetical protein